MNERANEVLSGLESDRYGRKAKSVKSRIPIRPLNQVDMFSPNTATGLSPVEEELKKIDVNNTTPIEALQILNELKQKLKD